jgi:NAD binding domain of 6-phosphogluconate dehydrogenase
MHDELAARGVAMLDAPVSGGTVRAASGELSILVGGAPETFARCRDLFQAMGKNVFHIGPIGQGLALKLVNNMLVQTNLVAVCEALVMGVIVTRYGSGRETWVYDKVASEASYSNSQAYGTVLLLGAATATGSANQSQRTLTVVIARTAVRGRRGRFAGCPVCSGCPVHPWPARP